MKKIAFLILSIFLSSCSSGKESNPLVIPPNFAEMPNLNNPEKISPEEQNASVERLKDLLLKSD